MFKALARWIHRFFFEAETVVSEQGDISDPREVLRVLAEHGGGVVKIDQCYYRFTVKRLKYPTSNK